MAGPSAHATRSSHPLAMLYLPTTEFNITLGYGHQPALRVQVISIFIFWRSIGTIWEKTTKPWFIFGTGELTPPRKRSKITFFHDCYWFLLLFHAFHWFPTMLHENHWNIKENHWNIKENHWQIYQNQRKPLTNPGKPLKNQAKPLENLSKIMVFHDF